MSNAHKGSRLLLRDQVIAVPFNSAHFDYNVDATGIRYGQLVEPLSDSVYTMRPYEGKFGGGIAIEESTTNRYIGPTTKGMYLISAFDGDYGFGISTNSQWTIDNSDQILVGEDVQKVTHMSGGVSQQLYLDWSDFIRKDNTTFTAGEERTISYYYKGTLGKSLRHYTAGGNIVFYSNNAIAGNGTTSITLPVIENEWQRVSFKAKNIGTGNATFQWGWVVLHSDQEITTANTYDYWKFTGIQTEAKSFATSYVSGTRNGGKIKYDIPLAGDFTITFWDNSYKDYHATRIFLELVTSVGNYRIGNGWGDDWNIYNPISNLGWTTPTPSTNFLTYSQTRAWITFRRKDTILTLGIFTEDGSYREAIYSNADNIIPSDSIYVNANSNRIMSELLLINEYIETEELQAWLISNKPFYNPFDYRAYSY